MKRTGALLIIIASAAMFFSLALVASATAQARGLSLHRAERAIHDYAMRDAPRRVQITRCRRHSQRRVYCDFTDYGVTLNGVPGWTFEFGGTATLRNHRIYVTPPSPWVDDHPYSEPLSGWHLGPEVGTT